MHAGRPIDKVFREYLTAAEKKEWDAGKLGTKASGAPLRGVARRVKHALKKLAGR
jgi:hypothetical protein